MALTEANSSTLVRPIRKWIESIFKRIAEGFLFYILRALCKLLLNILPAVWIDGFGVLTWFWGLHNIVKLIPLCSYHNGRKQKWRVPWLKPREWDVTTPRVRSLFVARHKHSLVSPTVHTYVYKPPRSVLQQLRNILLAQNCIFLYLLP